MVASPIWVTWMECLSPPAKPQPLAKGFTLARETISPSEYLSLYHLVGEQVKWDTRLNLAPSQLAGLLASTASHVFILRHGAVPIGLCEFEINATGHAELQHFGLAPSFHGKGLGICLLENAMSTIFTSGTTRIWLHTDEWDSPAALKTYQKAGFTIYDRKFMDPTPL
jgi:ribosomal protein S18 acetylase RimI-like enzyme